MQIDVDSLLRPVGEEFPCGEDLEYDPDFVALRTLAQGKPESQVGASIIAAEDPDYPAVASLALSVLERSKDLRVAVILAEAVLRTDGPVGFERVLAYVCGCLETYWDHVHPMLDADDDNDPTMRVNAMLGLLESGGEKYKVEGPALRALRLAPLTDSRRVGRFSLRDMMIASGELPVPAGMEHPPERSVIAAAFQDTAAERQQAIRAAVKACRGHVSALDALFFDRIGTEGPNLSPLVKMLQRIDQAIDSYMGAEAGAAEAAPEAETGSGGAVAGVGGPVMAGPGGSATISGPEDVVRAIDRICDYYARREPSSPVPLLLNRAKRLVSADFTTIIKDMASGGYDQVATIGGLAEE